MTSRPRTCIPSRPRLGGGGDRLVIRAKVIKNQCVEFVESVSFFAYSFLLNLTFDSWTDLVSQLGSTRLGHVHFKRMQDMSKDGLIPTFDMDTKNDLCDLHATPSLGNKKYFVTFIDDALRFCYVYLLHTKDEALDKFKVFKTKVELQQGSLIKRFRTDKEDSLGERGNECIFVGYVEHSKACRFFVIEPNESVSINYIIESRDAIFDENRFSSVLRPSLNIPKGTEDISGSVVPKKSLKRNLKVDGTIEKFKARLVIQGFRQKLGIDYFDTYALVARISTIRLLIAMASIHNLIIHQMDVKITFLNGELDEDVYMNQPQSFIMPGNENKVCILIKSLYGLKKAPKQWHQKFDEVVLSNGYLTKLTNVDLTKEFLSSRFSLKEMGEANVILGIRIKHKSNEITISQSHYIEKVLKKFNYFNCTPVSTSMDTSEKLMPNNGQTWVNRAGMLVILISNTEDNSSTSGRVFLLSGGTIYWASKKQTCITSLTMEYEFMALAAAGKEVEWLRILILKIPLWSKLKIHISIRCDSAATLAKAYSQIYNEKSRHLGGVWPLGVRHSMIHELIMNGVVSIKFVRSQRNLADHLTKGLIRDLVLKSIEGMGIKSN
ncbi:zinc finger, CCHC-type containing protein [Tanacetum coccineum]